MPSECQVVYHILFLVPRYDTFLVGLFCLLSPPYIYIVIQRISQHNLHFQSRVPAFCVEHIHSATCAVMDTRYRSGFS